MTIQSIGTVIMLALGSIWDIRDKQIPVKLLIAEIIAGVILMITNQKINWPDDWYLYIMGIFIGVVILLAGRFSNGSIGTADGIMLAVIGGVIGYRDTLLLLMNAVMAAALCSIILIILKRGNRKTTIPFFPFMLLGYLPVIFGNLI